MPELPSKCCLFCGRDDVVLTYDHIIPKALGGARTAKYCCQECNNRHLSRLVAIFTRETPIAYLCAHRFSTEMNMVGIEPATGEPIEVMRSPQRGSRISPQVRFSDWKNPEFIFDPDDIAKLSAPSCMRRFWKLLVHARNTLKRGRRPTWIWEDVAGDISRTRPTPRVYVTHPLHECTDKTHVVCKYFSNENRAKILSTIETYHPRTVKIKPFVLPPYSHYEHPSDFRHIDIVRALTYFAIGVMTQACKRTKIDAITFGSALDFIRTGVAPYDKVGKSLCRLSGFVEHSETKSLNCPKDCHLVRFNHYREGHRTSWVVQFAFFGGEAGAMVQFPGPFEEDWNTIDVEIPIGDQDWRFRPTALIFPWRPKTVWHDWSRAFPSLGLHDTTYHVVDSATGKSDAFRIQTPGGISR